MFERLSFLASKIEDRNRQNTAEWGNLVFQHLNIQVFLSSHITLLIYCGGVDIKFKFVDIARDFFLCFNLPPYKARNPPRCDKQKMRQEEYHHLPYVVWYLIKSRLGGDHIHTPHLFPI